MTACHTLAPIELEGICSTCDLKLCITVEQELLKVCSWIFAPDFRIFLFILSIHLIYSSHFSLL